MLDEPRFPIFMKPEELMRLTGNGELVEQTKRTGLIQEPQPKRNPADRKYKDPGPATK